jgi:mono/diheme cytochrome c family protein
MRSIRKFATAAAFLAPVLMLAGAANAADAEAGKEAFLRFGCYTCHGYEGQGANTGPKLAPNPLPYETLSTFVRQTSGDMPPFTPATLSEAELQNIYAYLQSRPAVPDAGNIPLLQNID